MKGIVLLILLVATSGCLGDNQKNIGTSTLPQPKNVTTFGDMEKFMDGNPYYTIDSDCGFCKAYPPNYICDCDGFVATRNPNGWNLGEYTCYENGVMASGPAIPLHSYPPCPSETTTTTILPQPKERRCMEACEGSIACVEFTRKNRDCIVSCQSFCPLVSTTTIPTTTTPTTTTLLSFESLCHKHGGEFDDKLGMCGGCFIDNKENADAFESEAALLPPYNISAHKRTTTTTAVVDKHVAEKDVHICEFYIDHSVWCDIPMLYESVDESWDRWAFNPHTLLTTTTTLKCMTDETTSCKDFCEMERGYNPDLVTCSWVWNPRVEGFECDCLTHGGNTAFYGFWFNPTSTLPPCDTCERWLDGVPLCRCVITQTSKRLATTTTTLSNTERDWIEWCTQEMGADNEEYCHLHWENTATCIYTVNGWECSWGKTTTTTTTTTPSFWISSNYTVQPFELRCNYPPECGYPYNPNLTCIYPVLCYRETTTSTLEPAAHRIVSFENLYYQNDSNACIVYDTHGIASSKYWSVLGTCQEVIGRSPTTTTTTLSSLWIFGNYTNQPFEPRCNYPPECGKPYNPNLTCVYLVGCDKETALKCGCGGCRVYMPSEFFVDIPPTTMTTMSGLIPQTPLDRLRKNCEELCGRVGRVECMDYCLSISFSLKYGI